MANKGIQHYSETSSLMDITINWEKQRFKFNLHQELVISEEKINKEVTDQPSSYAFINMLWKKLVLKAEEAKIHWEKTESKEYIRFKKKVNEDTNRPYADDLAKASSKASSLTALAYEEYRKAKNEANTLETCVKAFEMRASLIQTLAANQRSENRS